MTRKPEKKQLYNIAGALALAIFFFVDRFLKDLALRSVVAKALIPQWLSFNFTPNYQIAFSLPLSGPGLDILIFIMISILIVYWYRENKKLKSREQLALWLMICGAISNLFDRLSYGFVIDYFDLRWFTVFNIADILITGGAIILAVSLFLQKKKDPV